MRSTVRCICGVAIALLFASSGMAQTYPSQTVKIVVPFPPGGGVDVVARMIAPKLSEQLGQSVIIENRGGAGGSLGAIAVAQAPRDGYTLLLGTASTHGTNPNVYAKLPLRSGARLRARRADHPGASGAARQQQRAGEDRRRADRARQGQAWRAFVRLLRDRQQQSPVAELLNTMAGIKHQSCAVPGLGADDDRPDRRAHPVRIRWRCGDARLYPRRHGAAAGRLYGEANALASRRADHFEFGGAGVRSRGLVRPVRAGRKPKAAVDLLNQKINVALALPEIREGFLKVGNEPVGGAPEILAAKVQAELRKWTAIVREKNIRIEQ